MGGIDVNDVADKLERFAQVRLERARNNAVRFKKTDRSHHPLSQVQSPAVSKGDTGTKLEGVSFARETSRWLGIWLDSALTLRENRRHRLDKTRQAEAKIRRIVNQYGAPPAAEGWVQHVLGGPRQRGYDLLGASARGHPWQRGGGQAL